MDLATLQSQVDKSYPPGEGLQVSQNMIQQFAYLTGDHQWIHLDVERCRRESPFRSTIAHWVITKNQ